MTICFVWSDSENTFDSVRSQRLFCRLAIQLTATRIARKASTLPAATDPYCTLRPWNDRPMSRHVRGGVEQRRHEPGHREALVILVQFRLREAKDDRRDDERDAHPAEKTNNTLHG